MQPVIRGVVFPVWLHFCNNYFYERSCNFCPKANTRKKELVSKKCSLLYVPLRLSQEQCP